jgi:hypothetical protein
VVLFCRSCDEVLDFRERVFRDYVYRLQGATGRGGGGGWGSLGYRSGGRIGLGAIGSERRVVNPRGQTGQYQDQENETVLAAVIRERQMVGPL